MTVGAVYREYYMKCVIAFAAAPVEAVLSITVHR